MMDQEEFDERYSTAHHEYRGLTEWGQRAVITSGSNGGTYLVFDPSGPFEDAKNDEELLPLTDDERQILTHNSMWGSDGYPVEKFYRGSWYWRFGELRSPVVFKTKREAVASWEAYIGTLVERSGAEAQKRALAALNGGS